MRISRNIIFLLTSMQLMSAMKRIFEKLKADEIRNVVVLSGAGISCAAGQLIRVRLFVKLMWNAET